MKMSIVTINLLLLAFVSTGKISAQSKNFTKLKKDYLKGDYEKVIRKADKLRAKDSRNSTPYYFLSLAYMQMYRNGNNDSYLNKSVSRLKKAKKYDTSLSLWALLEEEIEMLEAELNSKTLALSADNRAKGRKLCQSYIELFDDTLKCCSGLFESSKIEYEVVEELDKSHLISVNNKRDSIKALGLSLVGVPYAWAGETPKGFDCSGFVMYVYNSVGLKLPHNANKISYLGKEVNVENAKVGDVILFGSRKGKKHNAFHAGIIHNIEGGDIQVIHCVSQGVHICEDFDLYWKDQLMMIVNIVDDAGVNSFSEN